MTEFYLKQYLPIALEQLILEVEGITKKKGDSIIYERDSEEDNDNDDDAENDDGLDENDY